MAIFELNFVLIFHETCISLIAFGLLHELAGETRDHVSLGLEGCPHDGLVGVHRARLLLLHLLSSIGADYGLELTRGYHLFKVGLRPWAVDKSGAHPIETLVLRINRKHALTVVCFFLYCFRFKRIIVVVFEIKDGYMPINHLVLYLNHHIFPWLATGSQGVEV